MFGRIFGPDNPPAAQKTEKAFQDATAGETETGPADRRASRGPAAGARPPGRVRGLHPGACGACRPRHHRRGDAADRAAAPGAGHARRTDRGARGRDGAAQARTVGDTEDYVVTREFKAITTHDQRKAMLWACFAIGAENGVITAEEASVINQIARELDLDQDTVNEVRAEYHELLSSVQAVRRIADGQTET